MTPLGAVVRPAGTDRYERTLANVILPAGRDEGNEAIEIANHTAQPVDLAGWRLVDKAGNQYRLAGTVAARGRLRVVMTTPTMPLNNDGDTMMLIAPAGVVRCRVEYTGEQVQRGEWEFDGHSGT